MKDNNPARVRGRIGIVLIGMAVLIAAFLIFQVWRSYHCPEVHELSLSSDKLEREISAAVISDLHDAVFGEDNEELIRLIVEASPDLVIMDGDMINSYSENIDGFLSLVERLAQSYPVYFAWGNHELEYGESHPELEERIREAGAVVLEQDYVDITVRDQAVRIGGMYGYAFGLSTGQTEEMKESDRRTYQFLCEFQNTNAFKIMLAHRPDSFIFGDAAKAWDIDLVISGHVHGGQVVLPFVGGLWAPDQGWFPGYVSGLYEKGKIRLVITAGLGSQKETFPRFNNPPEVLIVRLGAQ